MNRKKAIDTLIAHACCCEPLLSCIECPFHIDSEDDIDMSECKTDRKDIVKAVRVLKERESK